MDTELSSSASTTLFVWQMPTIFQSALHSVTDPADGLVLVTLSMDKARGAESDGQAPADVESRSRPHSPGRWGKFHLVHLATQRLATERRVAI